MSDETNSEGTAEIRSNTRLRIGLGVIGLILFVGAFTVLVWGNDLLSSLSAWRFDRVPTPLGAAKPADQAEADRQDLDMLAQFAGLDASLTAESRAAFEAERQALRAKAGTLSRAQFALGVAHAVAHAGNLNSNVDFAATPPSNRLPVTFEWFADGLHVVAALPQGQALLGARIDAIDGRTPDELAAAYRPFRGGGTDANLQAAALWFLASPAALNAVWPDVSFSAATLQAMLPNGSAETVTLDAVAAPPETGHRLLDTGLPLSLQEPDRALFARPIGDGLYLRLAGTADDASGPFERQLAAVTHPPDQGGLRWIVLDLRWLAGGDTARLASPMRDLPGRLIPGGKLFVLTGPRTVGAGMTAAAVAKFAGGDNAILEGEPVGDSLQFWAEEGAPLRLPNSGLVVNFATAYHDLEHGCRSLGCYWPDVVDGVAVGSLKPQVAVRWAFDDYRNGIDPLLQRLSDMTRERDLLSRSK